MRNKVLRICENCIWVIGHALMIGMGTMIMLSIGFAFYQLFLQMFG